MPKVTLLRETGEDYTLVLGKQQFVFYGKAPKDVPTAVALAVQKVRKSDGSSMFTVDGMPTIVAPATKKGTVLVVGAKKVQKPVAPPAAVVEQTALGKPRQMRVDAWL